MKKSKRRNYTDEFKEEAVKLVTEQHYKITEAARNLGVHHSLLRRWIKVRSPESESSNNATVQLKAELKRVKRENEQLRMEREILKKAAAFFCVDSMTSLLPRKGEAVRSDYTIKNFPPYRGYAWHSESSLLAIKGRCTCR